MIEYPFKQGTAEWHECRRGVITASRAKDVRRTDGLTAQQRIYVDAMKAGHGEASAKEAANYKAKPTAALIQQAIDGTLVPQFGEAAHTYAKELARERCGGKDPEGFQGLSQRVGHEEEPFAAIEYVAKTGRDLEEAFFITTDDRKYGMSLDRWVLPEGASGVQITLTVAGTGEIRAFVAAGALEVKTMVSSSTLFKAMVDEDISEYIDQCLFGLWHFTLPWIDLCLWCPDLQALHVIRIERDEDTLQALENDLVAFDGLVAEYETKLLKAMGRAPASPPWAAPATKAAAITTTPEAKPAMALADPVF